MEFSTICRVCMQPISLEYIDLDTPFNEATYFECFNYCTKLEAKASDKLPKSICVSCANLLQMAYDFINAAVEADRLFRECFAQLGDHVDNADIKFIDEDDEILSKEIIVVKSYSDKNKTLGSEIESTVYKELIIDVDDDDDSGQKDDLTQYNHDDIKIKDTELIEPTDVFNGNDIEFVNVESIIDVEKLDDTIEVKKSTKTKTQTQTYGKVFRYILPKGEPKLSLNEAIEKQINFGFIQPKKDPEIEENFVAENEKFVDASKDLVKVSRLKEKKKTSIFKKCRICSRKIIREKYGDHMNQHTGNKAYKCDKCEDCSFFTLHHFKQHKAQMHKKFRYAWSCKQCGEAFESSANLNIHCSIDHSNENNGLCITCGDCLFDQGRLEWHVKKEHWSRRCPVECTYCKKRYQLNTLPKHVKYAHLDVFCASQNKEFTCKFCFQIFDHATELEEHITTHKGKNNYTCATCGKEFKGLRVFKLHKATMHQVKFVQPKIRKCNKCDFTTNTLFLLVKHKRKTHYKTKAKPKTLKDRTPKYLCAYCPNRFVYEKSLRDHEDYKHGEQKTALLCDLCDQKFCSNYKLIRHKKSRHANDRPFMCKECPKAFKLRAQLSQHQKIHYGKKYDCPHCEKKFVRPCYLRVHLRTHTNELPFECHLCDKKFAIKVRLTYHLARHEGILRKCEHCPEAFESMAKLRIHRFEHIGYPYVCDLCKKNHHRKVGFIRHMKRYHGQIMTPALVEENRLRNMQNFYRNSSKIEPEADLEM